MNTTYYFCSILHQYATHNSAYKITHNREKVTCFFFSKCVQQYTGALTGPKVAELYPVLEAHSW